MYGITLLPLFFWATLVSFTIGLYAEEPMKKGEAIGEGGSERGHPFSWAFRGWEKMQPYGGKTRGSAIELERSTKPSYAAIYEEGLSKRERDRRAILSLVGDYRVSFDFIETAGAKEGYEPQRPYFSWATERAFVVEERVDFISIQHILVMEFLDEKGEIQGPFTMKHWRQDWTYEEEELLQFYGNGRWGKSAVGVSSGTWSQMVYQVDDSPRYEVRGRWVHTGGLSTFSTEDFWRPLPRREFSIRDDYNVLAGRHELIVNPTGWLHVQSNRKLVVKEGQIEEVVATELGAVRYEEISAPDLSLAESYWEKTNPYWAAVRAKWAEVIQNRTEFTLKKKVNDKRLFSHHFAHAAELEKEDGSSLADLLPQASTIIDAFLSDVTSVSDGENY